MHSKDLLLIANRQAAAVVFPALEDLKSAPLISPTPHCPNHAHWIVGHLIFSEGRYREMTLGVPNPCQSMQAMFGGGPKPSLDGKDYPKYEDLFQKLQSMQEESPHRLHSRQSSSSTTSPQLAHDRPSQCAKEAYGLPEL